MASFLKYWPTEKLPSISKKVRCEASPTSSISVVRKHFCTEVSRTAGGTSRPRKNGIICCMPAVVSSTVGSLRGTSEELGTIKWPLLSKKLRNCSRISAPVMSFPFTQMYTHLPVSEVAVLPGAGLHGMINGIVSGRDHVYP